MSFGASSRGLKPGDRQWYHPRHRIRARRVPNPGGRATVADEERNEEQSDQHIKVVDRRHFTADGDRRGDAPDEPEPVAATAEQDRERAAEAGFERRPVDEPRGVDFTMLINAMAQPALLFLGEIPHPESDEPTVDLTQARLQIDLLDVLKVKCRGNLTPEEDGLLDRVLYQLRMLYVARSNQPG